MNDRETYLDYYVAHETKMHKFNPVEMVSNFGQNIARLRTEAGFTQQELSKMTGINCSTMVRIELGNIQRINMVDAMKLANFFHMPLLVLCGQGNDLYDLYSSLIKSSSRTQRLVRCILESDVQMQKLKSDFNSEDLITKITFAQPIRDGINTTRFLFEHDNISMFKNYQWYSDAYALVEINSTNYHPLYHMGDRLVISCRHPQDGEIGIFIKGNELYIRRVVSVGDKWRLENLYRADDKNVLVVRKNTTDMDQFVKFGTVEAVI